MKRRDFIKISGVVGAGLMVPRFNRRAIAAPAATALSDPALQPKFVETVPNALDPSFMFAPTRGKSYYDVGVGQAVQFTGLVDSNEDPISTTVFGYGQGGIYTWPGKTFEVKKGDNIRVLWANELVKADGSFLPHLLPVDTSLHWAYSLHGYTQYTLENAGIPIIPHVHGGHNDFKYDGNPEFFFSPGWKVRGPQWAGKTFVYHLDQPAGTVWYHDHALGITRLNVYAGMAGFFIIRDEFDTGLPGNPLGLPAFPYEVALAIQDRMFKETGELFYPAFPDDPYYEDFIEGEEAELPEGIFPGGGPTALAEFFGDHMVVNGKIWPKMEVEPRNYRLRLLNGCDSRFLAVQFFEVPAGATDFSAAISGPLDFTVIGSDQGLASSPTTMNTLLMETGSRYDIIFDFKTVNSGNRVIMKNIGGDEPFGGDIPGPQLYGETNRIMAFDVVSDLDETVNDVSPTGINFGPNVPAAPSRIRKVALFEGKDEFGRLQPLLGTAEPATDFTGRPINWPNTPVYTNVGLTGQMEGSIAWHSPTTENPALGSTEEWEIWNATGDAHPVHLHLVHFEVLGRQEIVWDSATNEDDRVLDPAGVTAPAPNGDGTYLVTQPVVQHNGMLGNGFKLVNLTKGAVLSQPSGYVENAPKDMVTALPGQITRIKATFDKPGRYVWHCHILSHEDHEMMRVLHVGGGAQADREIADTSVSLTPNSYALEQNYPNPFNPTTEIRFQLPNNEKVELTIFNSLGQKVRTLVNENMAAGVHSFTWNGRDNFGNQVSSGIYIYKIEAGSFSQVKRMTLLK
jgi:spore coat protein A